MSGYVRDDITAEELERQRALYGPFTQAVRELVDATIRTEVDDDEIRAVQAEVEALVQDAAAAVWLAHRAGGVRRRMHRFGQGGGDDGAFDARHRLGRRP